VRAVVVRDVLVVVVREREDEAPQPLAARTATVSAAA
jgi:hypothetical protein